MLPRLGLNEPKEGIHNHKSSLFWMADRRQDRLQALVVHVKANVKGEAVIFGRGLLLSPRHSLNPRLMSLPAINPAGSLRSHTERASWKCHLPALQLPAQCRMGLIQVSVSTGNQAWEPRTKPSPLICRQHGHQALITRRVRGWLLKGWLLHSSAPNQFRIDGLWGEEASLAPWKGTGRGHQLWGIKITQKEGGPVPECQRKQVPELHHSTRELLESAPWHLLRPEVFSPWCSLLILLNPFFFNSILQSFPNLKYTECTISIFYFFVVHLRTFQNKFPMYSSVYHMYYMYIICIIFTT